MDIGTFITGSLLSVSPISELRGGLPVLLAAGMHPVAAYFYAVFLNILVTPIVLVFLSTFHRLFSHFRWYNNFFGKLIERARKKVQAKVDKYGYAGLLIFVAIPLPFTGAYTGALGAWILGMNMKKSFLVISLGVALAGMIVSGAILLAQAGLEFFKIFFK